jgi:nitrogen fixation/metabolism regulation signal transduction histidine kinase
MAHEIKNPLTPIQLSAERIAKSYHRLTSGGARNGENGSGREDTRVTAVIDECTDTIAREVAGLKALVDEFSRFARLPIARPEPADLNEVSRHAVALYDGRGDGVRLETRLSPQLPVAALDAEQMRRVFVNLIDNALNALVGVNDAPVVVITTTFDPLRGLLVAEVADNGNGILPSDFKKLFQPYFSTRGGAGLGLAIVQKIIMDHGGRIRAQSNHPRGAKFVIELPSLSV